VLGYSEPAKGLRLPDGGVGVSQRICGWPEVGFAVAQMGRAAIRASNIDQ
jgi:hypothetical protein